MMSDRISKKNTHALLRYLNVEVIHDDGNISLLSLSEIPDVVVEVRTDSLRQWCLKRIESRKHHVGKAIRSQGGYSNTLRRLS